MATTAEVAWHGPRAGARAPARGRADVMALVLPLREGLHLPAVMRTVASVVTAMREHDMDVLLVTADQGADGLRRVADSPGVCGFLVMDVGLDDKRVPVLCELGRPAVLIGCRTAPEGLPCVDLDFEAAGACCVDHLAGLGHRRIGFLGAPGAVYAHHTGFAQRTLAGVSAAAMRYGVACTALPIETDQMSVFRATRAFLRLHPETTALVVHNEVALAWVTRCLHELGRRVPEDVAVVAICPDELAGQMSPPLTSVELPTDELGRRAVDLLVRGIDGHDAQPPLTLLPPRFSHRASTALGVAQR